MTSPIPLFPLPLVVFPGAVQALHIFEPRYRRLLADALAGDGQFGVVCVLPGQDEGALPEGTVGCLVHIESAMQLPDGRSNIMVIGGARFQLRGYEGRDTPYYVGRTVPYADLPEGPEPEATASEVRALFERAGRASRTIQNEPTPVPELPAEAPALSFAVAQYLDLPLEERQALLASPSPAERLARLRDLLAGMIGPLETRARAHAGARRNGHGSYPPAS